MHNMKTRVVIASVSKALNISVETLKSKNRKREISDAKKIAIGLIVGDVSERKNCQRYPVPLKTLKTMFGHLNHTTVMYSIEAYNNLKDNNPMFKAKLESVLKAIK